MELDPYVDEIREHVTTAAAATGEQDRAVAERLLGPLDAAVRLAVQHALADAADQITVELAPGSVELRVRGRELAFVVVPPPEPQSEAAPDAGTASSALDAPDDPEGDGAVARINLRVPEPVKARVEQAARREGVSINTWLVRAATAALQRADAPAEPDRRVTRGVQHYRGWVK